MSVYLSDGPLVAATLIIGGSGGIGAATVRRFAAEGDDVVLTFFNGEARAAEVVAACAPHPGDVVATRADVTRADDIARAVELCGDRLRTVVFAAASGVARPMAEAKPRHWDWVFGVNAKAFAVLFRVSLTALVANEGSLVALSSPGSRLAFPDYATVGPSKAALEAMVRYASAEAGPQGVRVNAVSPGPVETKALESFPEDGRKFRDLRQRTPLGRLATVEDVANTIWWLASDQASMISGQVLVVDGGLSIHGATD